MKLLAPLLLTASLSTAVPADYVRANARVVPGLGRFPDAVATDLAPFRAVLVGETHGTREAPRLALELARAVIHGGRAAWLGLEIPEAEQAALDSFRETGDINILKRMPFFHRPMERQDGRSSAAMAAMLDMVQKLPDIPVYCIDVDAAASAQERDEGMAKLVAKHLAERPGAVGVTLTGNVHANMAQGTSWDARYRPMGFVLSHGLFPADKVISVEIRYQQITAWNRETVEGGAPEGGLHTHTAPASALMSAVPWGAYFLRLPAVLDGWGGVLFWRTMSASPPFAPALPAPPSPTPTPTHRP